MKQCWICNQWFSQLSSEHIIPRLFEGYVTTDDFSCVGCNHSFGEIEQQLSPVSILMQNLDNADGTPSHVVPTGESPKKEKKWSFGEGQRIELSTSGRVRADGWERSPGKIDGGDIFWRPGRIPLALSVDTIHKSMLKAITVLACKVGFPRRLLKYPLEYLSGNGDVLTLMRPTNLGIPSRRVFARVWVFAPPAKDNMSIYGAVVYGPLAKIYRLAFDLQPAWSFCCELKAYSQQVQCYPDQPSYMAWRSSLLQEVSDVGGFQFVGRAGVYAVKESKQSGLLMLETSPSEIADRSRGTYGWNVPVEHPVQQYYFANRFENWVRRTQSDEEHELFLGEAKAFDKLVRQWGGP